MTNFTEIELFVKSRIAAGYTRSNVLNLACSLRAVAEVMTCSFCAARAEDIDSAIAAVAKSRKWAKSTVLQVRVSLRVFYRWLTARHDLTANPCPIPVRKSRYKNYRQDGELNGYITYEEAKAHLGFGFATNKIPAWAIKKVGRRNWFLEWVTIDWRKSIEIEMLKDWFIAYSTEQPTPFEICAMNDDEDKFSNALSKLKKMHVKS